MIICVTRGKLEPNKYKILRNCLLDDKRQGEREQLGADLFILVRSLITDRKFSIMTTKSVRIIKNSNKFSEFRKKIRID
ncbi:hypothetical protein BpHYR1_046485 [Brachionus plicatilis]|uniref:Uncharacterized protein n=1 Tax=Brachionus plicatilis TaxID=10195 RepID=A0A3M7P873_BRAPC|nr:hypothetical protein BpHYR1_046485 [Brachionus plicatilis]